MRTVRTVPLKPCLCEGEPASHAAGARPALATFYMNAACLPAVGLRANAFIVAPLAVFAAVVFGFAFYNTICKNAHVNLFNC